MTPKPPLSKEQHTILKGAQRLRLRRFGMSVITYIVAILATFLATKLGIGALSNIQWAMLLGWCLFGMISFFILFYTNANLHFSEASLTREQIIFSSIYGFLLMYWMPDARAIIFLFILAPFSFGMLILTFQQFLFVTTCMLGLYGGLLVIDYTNNPQGFDIHYQLYLFLLFSIILTWFTFFGGFVSVLRRRIRIQKDAFREVNENYLHEINDRKQTQLEKDKLIVKLEESLTKVRTLEGIIPICMHCKEIRDDKGSWNKLEIYISEHSDAQFSHSLCEKCLKKYYPEFD